MPQSDSLQNIQKNAKTTWAGFRNEFGTREAFFNLMVLMQKCGDQQKDAFHGFIDYERGFDRFIHALLIECVHKSELDLNDIRIIKELYWN